MFEDFNRSRFFSVSPPTLDRVPRPKNVLFEDKCSSDKENENKNSHNSDTIDTVNNFTCADSDTNNIYNSDDDSSTESLEPQPNSEKRHSLTRRDFVLDETATVTRSTKTLDSYDLDVKLRVKPRYYQKWARNKRSRSSTDAAFIQPFSMLIRQQHSACSTSAKRGTAKRKKSTTAKRRVHFERERSTLSFDYEFDNKLSSRIRKSIAGTSANSVNVVNHCNGFTKRDSKCEILLKSLNKEQELVGSLKDRCTRASTIVSEAGVDAITEKPLKETDKQHKPQQCSVIPMNDDLHKATPHKPNSNDLPVHLNMLENGIHAKERKDDENATPNKVAFDVKTELNIATKLLNADIRVGVSNQNARTGKRLPIDGFDEEPDTGLSDNYSYYPSRPIYNDIYKRRERQSMLFDSDPVTFRRSETGTEVSLKMPDKTNEIHKGKVPVKLSKSSPRYSGPNNLFVDFETLRITAHLQKLDQYRTSNKSPLTIPPPSRRLSNVTSPIQVIGRNGFKTVVLGFSAK